MKGVNYQVLYDVDDRKYPYTAFNNDGALTGFQNLPVRNFETLEWIDSVTGVSGDLIPFGRWVSSMRIMEDMRDMRIPPCKRPRRTDVRALLGKKGTRFKRKDVI
jgi:hypothetical protein